VVTPASPLGRGLLGKKVGDVVEVMVKGELAEWEITYAA
jgi:transcription elongation GreA/GreB family factor